MAFGSRRAMGPIVSLALGVAACLLVGCQRAESTGASPDEPDQALARVGESIITKTDLDAAALRTLGKQAGLLDEVGRRKLLESLVTGRVIAREADKALTPRERRWIEREVAAYREGLLIQKYLASQGQAVEITREMIQAHYDAHPERFGARVVRHYEMLMGTQKLDDPGRSRLVTELRKTIGAKDWEEAAKGLQAKGLPVAFRQGEANERLLDPQLVGLMKELEPGQVSRLGFVKGKAYVVRVVSESTTPPRPLAEVADDIRAALRAKAQSDGIKKVSEQLLTTNSVEFSSASSSPQ